METENRLRSPIRTPLLQREAICCFRCQHAAHLHRIVLPPSAYCGLDRAYSNACVQGTACRSPMRKCRSTQLDTIPSASLSNIRRADLRQLIPPNPDMRSKLDEPCSSRTVSSTGLHRARKFQATQCGTAWRQPLSAQLIWAA